MSELLTLKRESKHFFQSPNPPNDSVILALTFQFVPLVSTQSGFAVHPNHPSGGWRLGESFHHLLLRNDQYVVPAQFVPSGAFHEAGMRIGPQFCEDGDLRKTLPGLLANELPAS